VFVDNLGEPGKASIAVNGCVDLYLSIETSDFTLHMLPAFPILEHEYSKTIR